MQKTSSVSQSTTVVACYKLWVFCWSKSCLQKAYLT